MPRRLLLAFVVVLSLGLSLPALAEPGGQGAGLDGGPPTTVTAPDSGGGPPTTVTTPGNSNGGGPPTTVTTPDSGGPPTTVTVPGSGSGQGSGPSTTVTNPGSGNGQSENGIGQGAQGSGSSNGQPIPAASTPADDSVAVAGNRVAVFLAPVRVSQESNSPQPVRTGQAQSAPERMISWLMSADQRRFLPVVVSPLVALIIVGRALASAGSGAVAPIVLLLALAVTKLSDRHRSSRLASIAASS